MSEHFVKQSYGKLWHFCHNSQGICFCTMTNEELKEYEILLREGQSDFDVLIDDSDVLHLVCQNDKGDIIYLSYSEQSWHKYVVMISKTPSAYSKNFNIQRINNWINIFYTIDYKGKKMLTHQIIENDDAPPNVVDCITGNFSVAKDSSNNIFVLFFSEGQNKYGYRKYAWSKKEWEAFVEIDSPENFKKPYIFIDRNDNMHIVGMVGDDVVYISNDVQVLAQGENPIIMEKESIYLMWEGKKDSKVWVSQKDENSNDFQKPTEFMAGRFAPLKIFSLAYTIYEQGINAMHCYGFISDNIVKLYMQSNFFNVQRTKPKPIQKNITEEVQRFAQKLSPQAQVTKSEENSQSVIELTKLKIQLGQVISGIEKLNHRLDSIETVINNISDQKQW